ncbi:hypothetical protein [Nocardioides sp. AX2bis]|uniref:hypothetical protein n=1 Tax=Nocardioides sp. AX2bis TaxID=2653157 RepID=UPI0012F11C8A|nr:hypothetical protein [Nocardioides sp. AX2bis]VXC14279.1 conserved hypothetical protein [Nocardioides sp. AX2bis]
MGSSLPPAAAADLVNSYARRVADDVELVLDGTTARPGPDDTVVLRRGEHHLTAVPTVSGSGDVRRLVARFPRADLTDGTWKVRLRTPDGPLPLGCRLLVQGERPVVLLWGDEAAPSRPSRARPRPDQDPAPRQPAASRLLRRLRRSRRLRRLARLGSSARRSS